MDNNTKSCNFCKPKEMSIYVYNNDKKNKSFFKKSNFRYWYCVLCLHPIEIGHTLIIYKDKGKKYTHKPLHFEEIEEDAWKELQIVIKACKDKIRSSKLNENLRTFYFFMLSETPPHHLHFHLIPNYIQNTNELKEQYGCFYKELLEMVKKEFFEKEKKVAKEICCIPTKFGHWYLGILEMIKNLKCSEDDHIEIVQKAAEALCISDKIDYYKT